MNTIELDDALRSLFEDIGDAAGAPREFADLPHRVVLSRRRRPGTLAAVGLAAAALVGLVVVSVQRSREPAIDSTRTNVTWLDMPTTPAGMERLTNDELAGLSICLDARIVSRRTTCDRIEGRTEIAYASTTDTEAIYEIQTLFSDLDLDGYIDGLTAGGPSTTRTDLTVRGGRPGVLLDAHNGVVLLVWQERPGVIGQFRSVDAPSATDVPALVESLIDRPWPTDIELPVVAVNLGVAWTANDNNHPYVIASHPGDSECLTIGSAPHDSSTARTTCATDALDWTSGTISTSLAVASDHDVVAGWVPDAAVSVKLTLPDGTDVELPANPVSGFTRRAWGYVIPADQGIRFTAHLVVLDATGARLSEFEVDFVNPVIFVDTVCANADSNGTVPDVRGLPIYAAANALRAAGLIIAHPLRGDPTQVITAQNPAPGSDLQCGDVDLTVGR